MTPKIEIFMKFWLFSKLVGQLLGSFHAVHGVFQSFSEGLGTFFSFRNNHGKIDKLLKIYCFFMILLAKCVGVEIVFVIYFIQDYQIRSGLYEDTLIAHRNTFPDQGRLYESSRAVNNGWRFTARTKFDSICWTNKSQKSINNIKKSILFVKGNLSRAIF